MMPAGSQSPHSIRTVRVLLNVATALPFSAVPCAARRRAGSLRHLDNHCGCNAAPGRRIHAARLSVWGTALRRLENPALPAAKRAASACQKFQELSRAHECRTVRIRVLPAVLARRPLPWRTNKRLARSDPQKLRLKPWKQSPRPPPPPTRPPALPAG